MTSKNSSSMKPEWLEQILRSFQWQKKSRKRESEAMVLNNQSCEASDYSTFLILLNVADSLKSDDHEYLLMTLILSPSLLAEDT